MNTANVQISVSTAPQVDRHTADNHRGPMVQQDQNSQIAHDTMTQRLKMPVQPDQVEKKKVDPNDKRHENQQKKDAKKAKGSETRKNNVLRRPRNDGTIVDVTV